MKTAFCLALAVFGLIVHCFAAGDTPKAAVAWFTNAKIADSISAAGPSDALPEASGSVEKGISLTGSMAIENPLLRQNKGYISFWIKPNWDGNDGKPHRILWIGDPARNGLLVEKSDKGMLRYVMASPGKVSSARADVSGWRAGAWRHVVVAWFGSNDDPRPLGMALWIDKVCVDGPISNGNEFVNPDTLADKRVWIGDATTGAVMDELIFRNQFYFIIPSRTPLTESLIGIVYQDYFRTAPYTSISIDPDPCQAPADRRVVNGCPKQFGLRGELGGKMERMTEFVGPKYGNWTFFDAKPFIKWTTSNADVAIVDESGKVTGKSVGKCLLTAEFGSLKATYDLEVISIDQPDLDMLYVERLPRYSMKAAKRWPAAGDDVESVAHIGNYGYKSSSAGAVVKFEIIPDKNGNYRCDPDEKPVQTQIYIIEKSLAPRESIEVSFPWKWTDDPVWVRVSVDPQNKVAELCEANNERCELNVARAMKWGYAEKILNDNHENEDINLVGSFSYFDWFNGQAERLSVMMREAVYPSTSPIGIKDAIRTDNFFVLKTDNSDSEPYGKESEYYDGGFPIIEWTDGLLTISPVTLHEFGHTCLALADLYGFPVTTTNVFLKDENGGFYAGGELLPEINCGFTIFSSAQNVECGVAYEPLMSGCAMWLHPTSAGQIQHLARYRGDKFWGVQGRFMPSLANAIRIHDVNDNPLTGAAVYVYQVFNNSLTQNACDKYIVDQPKFAGNTDYEGQYLFPKETAEGWDDPDTDEVDGVIEVWNPFGRAKTDTAFTYNVSRTEGLLLLKIVSGDQTELHWLPQTEFNYAYYCGNTLRGDYTIRTSLKPSNGITALNMPEVPDALREKNLKPVAVIPEEMTVKCGEEFVLDGSKSYDPEGQPIIYRWLGEADEFYWLRGSISQDSIVKIKAPDEPTEVNYYLYLNDGVRLSDMASVKINVVK